MDALLANTSNITKILDAEVYQNIAITPSYSNIKSNPSVKCQLGLPVDAN
jgi:hypothetical protein